MEDLESRDDYQVGDLWEILLSGRPLVSQRPFYISPEQSIYQAT